MSIPLGEYRELGAGVELHCQACGRMKKLDLEKVIAGLVARGLGDENTGIRELARTFKRPCERCGALAWETRPAFPSMPGHDGTRA